ncbi:unnamed protein product, partial [marine sediment metagenome]
MPKVRMSLEKVFKKSWQVYKDNIGPLLLVVLLGILLISVFMVPGMVAFLVSITGSTGINEEFSFNVLTGVGLGIFIVTIILAVAASLVYSIALIKAAGEAESEAKIEIKKIFSFAYHKFWVVLITSILAGLGMFIGLILLVIPGLVLMIYFQFVIYVVLFEDKWGIDALKR